MGPGYHYPRVMLVKYVFSEEQKALEHPELNWSAENTGVLYPWEEIKPFIGGQKFRIIVKAI